LLFVTAWVPFYAEARNAAVDFELSASDIEPGAASALCIVGMVVPLLVALLIVREKRAHGYTEV
jgi:hypothetical protein